MVAAASAPAVAASVPGFLASRPLALRPEPPAPVPAKDEALPLDDDADELSDEAPRDVVRREWVGNLGGGGGAFSSAPFNGGSERTRAATAADAGPVLQDELKAILPRRVIRWLKANKDEVLVGAVVGLLLIGVLGWLRERAASASHKVPHRQGTRWRVKRSVGYGKYAHAPAARIEAASERHVGRGKRRRAHSAPMTGARNWQ